MKSRTHLYSERLLQWRETPNNPIYGIDAYEELSANVTQKELLNKHSSTIYFWTCLNETYIYQDFPENYPLTPKRDDVFNNVLNACR